MNRGISKACRGAINGFGVPIHSKVLSTVLTLIARTSQAHFSKPTIPEGSSTESGKKQNYFRLEGSGF